MFYCGDYVNGVRNGEGAFYTSEGENYYTLFQGQWQLDAPNGEGILTKIKEGYNQVSQGNLIDGLWNGYVSVILYDLNYNGEEFDMSYSAINGIPMENKTEDLEEASEWYFYAEDVLEDGQYVCAYDVHWEYDEDDDWEWPHYWYLYLNEGQTDGIVTFCD